MYTYEEFEKLVIQELYNAYNVIAVMIDKEIVYTVTGGKKKEWFPGTTITLLFKGFRYTYEPALSINREIKFHKSYNTYSDKKKIYFKTNHCPDKAYVESYDYYSEFRIERIFDVFDDEAKNYYESKDYGEKMAFRNKEACQQCCDWLNANKNNQR